MVKIIDTTAPNPYLHLHFLKKEKVVKEENGVRKYYTLHSYGKNYSGGQRIAYLQRFLGNIFSSLGRALFQLRTWRHFGKACFGSATKRLMILKPRLTIDVVPLNFAPYPVHDPAKLAELQKVLDLKKIKLNCQNPPPLIQRNHIRQEAINAYLEQAKSEKWWGVNHAEWYPLKCRLFQALDKITFEQLQSGLASCCAKLNARLKDQKYALGFVPHKSQQWIAELTLPLLSRAPETSFQNATELSVGVSQGMQSALNSPVKHFVIFDDASYSGAQLITTINALRSAILAIHKQEKCHLYLVVPFISKVALEWIQAISASSPTNVGHLKVHLITTDKNIKAMLDVFSEKEFWRLVQIENALHIYCNGRAPNKCLTFLEWKVADSNSIPLEVVVRYDQDPLTRRQEISDRFITDYPPPYRAGV